MSQIESRRRLEARENLELLRENQLVKVDEYAIAGEERRRKLKLRKKQRIEMSGTYSLIKGISTVMDKYFLDPLIGLIPGVGDTINAICALPFIYVSAVKVRSIPLTLAVIYYTLVDVLIGMIPFAGNVLDFFYRSYLKNWRLINGFVEDDKEIKKKVNRQAMKMAFLIAVVCLLIYLLVKFIIVLFKDF